MNNELQEIKQQASRMLECNQLTQAKGLYLQATRLNPDDAEAWFMLGAINGELGDIDEAIANCQRAIIIDNDNIDAMAVLGNLLNSQGSYKEALTYLQQVVEQDPEDAETWKVLAGIHGKTGSYDECKRCSHRVINLLPHAAAGYASLGNALFVQGLASEAAEPCQKAVELDPDNSSAWYLLGQVMEHAEDQKKAENAYQKTVTLDRGHVDAWLGLGRVRLQSDDRKGAEQAFNQAREQDPGNPNVWLALGILNKALGRPKAMAHFRKALGLQPDLVPACVQLGNLLQDHGNLEEARVCYDKALAYEPDDAEAHYNLGVLHQRQGLLDEARVYFDRAIQTRPDFVHAHWNRSFIDLIQGDYARGWDEYEWRVQLPENVARSFSRPMWDGSDPQGMSILVHDEQGYGDTFQFLRYLLLLQARGARVILECHRGLGGVLQGGHGFDELIERATSRQVIQLQYDAHCYLMSLPRLFATRLDNIPHNIPYIDADPSREAHWRDKLGEDQNFKVGIVWEGSQQHTNNLNRSCKLEDFSPLASIPNVSIYSLQKGPGAEQADQPPADMKLIRLDPSFDKDARFVDTAAMMKNLDLVISIDTSSVHLAGALGCPTWVLLCATPDWRWKLEGSETPWYPDMRLFRQQRPGHWDEVFEQVYEALTDLTTMRSR